MDFVRIRRVYWRNDPILTLAVPSRPPQNFTFARAAVKSAMIWNEVEKAGLPGVAGVWCHEAGAGRLFNVIAISQLYPGHASQAGMLAANCHAGNYAGRWTVVFVAPRGGEQSEGGGNLQEAAFVPIAFSVWAGHAGETGNRRAITSWLYLYLAPSDSGTPYVVGVGLALLTLAAELLVVARVRRAQRDGLPPH